MKKDVRPKTSGEFSATRLQTRQSLVKVLQLSLELETVYKTYPKLRSIVGHTAWQSMADVAYQQLLELNLDPANIEARKCVELNISRLEDIAATCLVRDETGLRDTVARVLTYRIANNLATR